MPTITVTTANIRSDNPVPGAAAKARIAQAAAQPGAVLGQEIDNPAYDKVWDTAMKAAGKTTWCQKSECPISVPADWADVRARIDNVHGGLAGVSPHRDISVVHADVDTARLSLLGCHTVSKPRKGVDESAWRIARWNEYIGALKALVQTEHELGLTVVFGGDLNQVLSKIPTIHPDAILLASSGLDHLWVLPAKGWAVTGVKKQVIPRTEEMDHPLVSATFELAPVVAPPKPPEVPVTRTPEQALKWTSERGFIPDSKGNKVGAAGWCKREVRSAFNVPSDGSADATEAWGRTEFKHPGDRNPPRGSVVWWTGGRSGHGHVAIARGDGEIRTTDLPNSGHWGSAPFNQPETKWGLKYVGWSEDIDGVRVFKAPASEKPETKPPVTPKPNKRRIVAEIADISHHQGKVDLKAAQKAGLVGLYHKCTEGETVTDNRHDERRKQAKALGLPFGSYHFARPDSSKGDGRDECRWFLEHAKPAPGDLPGCLDLEDRAGVAKWKLDRAELTAWVGDWVAEYERQVGAKPILYNVFDLDDTFGCRLWVARYSNAMTAPKIPAPWSTYDMWQFTNGVAGKPNSFPGLGHVDLNTRRDGVTLAKLAIPKR